MDIVNMFALVGFFLVIYLLISGGKTVVREARKTLSADLCRCVLSAHPVIAHCRPGVIVFNAVEYGQRFPAYSELADYIVSLMSSSQINRLSVSIQPFVASVKLEGENFPRLTMRIEVPEIDRTFNIDIDIARSFVGEKKIEWITGEFFSNDVAPIAIPGVAEDSGFDVYCTAYRSPIRISRVNQEEGTL